MHEKMINAVYAELENTVIHWTVHWRCLHYHALQIGTYLLTKQCYY